MPSALLPEELLSTLDLQRMSGPPRRGLVLEHRVADERTEVLEALRVDGSDGLVVRLVLPCTNTFGELFMSRIAEVNTKPNCV